MAIYEGRGDEGETVLPSLGSVSKAHPRVAVDGTVDELNSLVGSARPTGYDDIDDRLKRIQNHLHIVHATVTNPDPPAGHPTLRTRHVSTLERWIDAYDGVHESMVQHTLPGGTGPGSRLHHARTVCQRAERRVVALGSQASIDEAVPMYLNRLADVLFVFARVVNERSGSPEGVWPGSGTDSR